jgi:hypothetical protein
MRLVFSELKEITMSSFFINASVTFFGPFLAPFLHRGFKRSLILVAALAVGGGFTSAHALDLDWHGQFRAETNLLFGYSHGNLASATPPPSGNGYNIPSNGDSPASFQDLFFRLDPRVIVNDNVSLHSDIWLGLPDRGIFGGDTASNSNFYTTNTGQATLTANELYAEVATDFGTLTVGRIPLNWGLGLIWNNNHDNVFDRFPSTADSFRLVTKLGAFRLIPTIAKYRNGTNYGGSIGSNNGALAPGTTVYGGSSATDYTVALTYDNDDEQVQLGIMFMRRIAGMNAQIQNPIAIDTPYGTTALGSGYAYNTWDFYVNKKAGAVDIGVEVPIVTGTVAGVNYSTVAAAAKVKAAVNDHWNVKLNAGSADGQGNLVAGESPSKYSAFYFHPDYRPALIMFNYNLQNLSNGALSPYDNPVTNSRFLCLGVDYSAGKWTHGVQGIYAIADKVADGTAGSRYYDRFAHGYKTENGSAPQDKSLGFEMDYLLGYQWDESIRVGLDLGLYFPGKFYEFSNGTGGGNNVQKNIFASNLNLLVKF